VKYIDEGENNVVETIDVNVRGTNSVLLAAARAGVATVVLVSTDKATAPLNTYGATKQLGERLIGEYARRWTNTKFVATRFGNVVGSTGSVTWKWHHAIHAGDPIMMTDAGMTRFWLAPSEAVAIVERATHAPSGTVTIPLAAAMSMGDVAEAMGAKKVQTIGLRPGERMDEMLLSIEEAPRAIVDGGYMMLRPAYEVGRRNGILAYTSAAPREWVTAERMRNMVSEAKELW
jgi:UDP-glucose 4-epimerase